MPNDKAKALYESTIVASIETDKLVTQWDAEMLPLDALLLHIVAVELVPELVDQETATFVDKAETLDVSSLAVLADVDVRDTPLRVEVEALIVTISSLGGAHIGTRHLVSEVHAHSVQVRCRAELNTSQRHLLGQVVLLDLAERGPFKFVCVDGTERLHLLELWHPEVLARLRVEDHASGVG